MPILFDVESRPRPDLVERFLKPSEPFDPASVKLGNVKDPALRQEKITAAKLAHEAEDAARIKKAHDRAALNPLTGEIIAIGLKGEGAARQILEGKEKEIIQLFWDAFLNPAHREQIFCFWSGTGSRTENFDVDYIIRRSWILGVKVPVSTFNDGFLSRRLMDVTRRYLLGDNQGFCSLTDAADDLGIFGPANPNLFPKTKDDPVTGANFWEWWAGLMPAETCGTPEQQHARAVSYLNNDLDILAAIVERIL